MRTCSAEHTTRRTLPADPRAKEQIITHAGLILMGVMTLCYTLFGARFAERHLSFPGLPVPIFVGEPFVLISFVLCLCLFAARGNRPSIRAVTITSFFITFILYKAIAGYLVWGALACRNAALFYYPLCALFSFYLYDPSFFTRPFIRPLLIAVLWTAMAMKRVSTVPSGYVYTVLTLALCLSYRKRSIALIGILLSAFLFITVPSYTHTKAILLSTICAVGFFIGTVTLAILLPYLKSRQTRKKPLLITFGASVLGIICLVIVCTQNRVTERMAYALRANDFLTALREKQAFIKEQEPLYREQAYHVALYETPAPSSPSLTPSPKVFDISSPEKIDESIEAVDAQLARLAQAHQRLEAPSALEISPLTIQASPSDVSPSVSFTPFGPKGEGAFAYETARTVPAEISVDTTLPSDQQLVLPDTTDANGEEAVLPPAQVPSLTAIPVPATPPVPDRNLPPDITATSRKEPVPPVTNVLLLTVTPTPATTPAPDKNLPPDITATSREEPVSPVTNVPLLTVTPTPATTPAPDKKLPPDITAASREEPVSPLTSVAPVTVTPVPVMPPAKIPVSLSDTTPDRTAVTLRDMASTPPTSQPDPQTIARIKELQVRMERLRQERLFLEETKAALLQNAPIARPREKTFTLTSTAPPPTRDYIHSVDQNNNLWRIFVWKDALSGMIDGHLLFGIDFGKPFRSKSIDILRWNYNYGRVGWIEPHNSFIHLAQRGGVAGILFILFCIGTFVQLTFRALRTRNIIGLALLSSILHWGIVAFFNVFLELPYYAIPFWCTAGLTAAYLSRHDA